MSFLWFQSQELKGIINGRMSLDSILTPAFFMFLTFMAHFTPETKHLMLWQRSDHFRQIQIVRKLILSESYQTVWKSFIQLVDVLKPNWTCRRNTHPSPTSHLISSLTQLNSSFMIMIWYSLREQSQIWTRIHKKTAKK